MLGVREPIGALACVVDATLTLTLSLTLSLSLSLTLTLYA